MARHARKAVDEMDVLKRELLDLVEASHMNTPSIRALAGITPDFGK
jgi:hypothetical protein